MVSQEVAISPRTIAHLIEKDISEAHQRYTDAEASKSNKASDNKLFHSKSTSHAGIDDKPFCEPVHLNREEQQSANDLLRDSEINCIRHGMASSTTPPPACHQDLSFKSSKHGRVQIMEPESQDRPIIHPLLTKSKSTGWMRNLHHTCHQNLHSKNIKWYRKYISFRFLRSWNKKPKSYSVADMFLDDSDRTFPFSDLKIVPNDGLNIKEAVYRPFKILFNWKDTSHKTSRSSLTTSSGTPHSSVSSSSSGNPYT
ncbi:hypothetical protein KP509_16G040600 [Ceratopteris richardii]|uniref:Uncharacterized protein n=1 Tax=Ceratopteris richardii TaxID=49495 RepID=A0A8T2T3X6_CERRI|nr:hypothetical protein KP509_16G040600 [Ceratopteris richardii]